MQKRRSVKKVRFYKNVTDTNGGNKILFNSNKWYDVIFNCNDGETFYVIAENGEKIGFREDENDNLFCIQR